MEKTETVKFLDYEIVNTGNGDGWVLTKQSGALWECHLGNFHDVESAKKDAVHCFMIARPEEFSAQINARMRGSQIYMDYFKFRDILEKEGIEIPPEIVHADGLNFTLGFHNANDVIEKI
jgi:hypothetical protein